MRRPPLPTLPTLLAMLALSACAAAPLAPATRTGSVAGGFAFSVPAPLDVRAWTPDFVSIGRPDGAGFASRADLRLVAAGPEGGPRFEAFAVAAVRQLCSAEAQGSDVACGDARLLGPVASASMLQGVVVRLDRTRSAPSGGAASADAFAPVYVFDVSDRVPGPGPAALILSPPPGLPEAQVDEELLQGVARSLTFRDPAG